MIFFTKIIAVLEFYFFYCSKHTIVLQIVISYNHATQMD